MKVNKIENSHLKVAIAVLGVSNSGKSSSLFEVASELERKGYMVVPSVKNGKKDERRIVMIGDVCVAICPPGDTPDVVDDNFDFAISKNAEIIVYTQRTAGEVFNRVSNQQRNNNCWLVVKYKEKLVDESKFVSANQQFANDLVDQIIRLAGNISQLTVFPY